MARSMPNAKKEIVEGLVVRSRGGLTVPVEPPRGPTLEEVINIVLFLWIAWMIWLLVFPWWPLR